MPENYNIKSTIEFTVAPNQTHLILLKSDFAKNLHYTIKSKYYVKNSIMNGN